MVVANCGVAREAELIGSSGRLKCLLDLGVCVCEGCVWFVATCLHA
jgi:hypothetical protein